MPLPVKRSELKVVSNVLSTFKRSGSSDLDIDNAATAVPPPPPEFNDTKPQANGCIPNVLQKSENSNLRTTDCEKKSDLASSTQEKPKLTVSSLQMLGNQIPSRVMQSNQDKHVGEQRPTITLCGNVKNDIEAVSAKPVSKPIESSDALKKIDDKSTKKPEVSNVTNEKDAMGDGDNINKSQTVNSESSQKAEASKALQEAFAKSQNPISNPESQRAPFSPGDSEVRKIKRQFESASQMTSPILDSERSSNSANLSPKTFEVPEQPNQGRRMSSIEDKIKKFNQASTSAPSNGNSNTLGRLKRNNSFRNKDQMVPIAIVDYGDATKTENVDKYATVKSGTKPEIISATPIDKGVSDKEVKKPFKSVKSEGDTSVAVPKPERKVLDRTRSVDESTVRNLTSGKSAGNVPSFSSFKSSHSVHDSLYDEMEGKSTTAVEAGRSNERSHVKQEPNIIRKPIPINAKDLAKIPLQGPAKCPQIPGQQVPCRPCPGNLPPPKLGDPNAGESLFKTCKSKTRDKCSTLGRPSHSSGYYTRGSEEIWLIKKKDLEDIEQRVLQSFRKGGEVQQIREQDKIDFLSRPMSACKSVRRSPVPPLDSCQDTKHGKDSSALSTRSEPLHKTEHFASASETLNRRSKRLFHFRSESLDPQSEKMTKQTEGGHAHTLKRQTSVTCTCGHDKKMRSKSQGESIRAQPVPPEDPKEAAARKCRSRSQGDESKQSEPAPKSGDKNISEKLVQRRGDTTYSEVYEGTKGKDASEEELYEKYETLV